MEDNKLRGCNLVGTSTIRERVENDFYATPDDAIKSILDIEKLDGDIWEPACGNGAISKILHKYYPNSKIHSTDLIDRGFGIGGVDFLISDIKTDNIITNPPFNLAKQFIEKALNSASKKVIMFAKIQLLESADRKALFDKYPAKTIYVFSKRVNPLRNGSEFDENGKKWSSTMCFAWFVWEIGYKGKTIIEII